MASNAPVLRSSDHYLVCNACGTQYPVTAGSGKDECRICDDPRQFVPPEGQTFTTLRELRANHRNVWWQDPRHPSVLSVRTQPSFAISNRAELIRTPHGNILWDLIPFLDDTTVTTIAAHGGLAAIIISHPHYYSTWADWSRTFKCPIYVGAPDKEWLNRTDEPGAEVRFLTDVHTPIKINDVDIGMTAILAGGHFPGSLLLHYQDMLFVADTVFPSPSATNPVPARQPEGAKYQAISFSFFWSIPNRIPLTPEDILQIWESVKGFDFVTAFGAFEGMDVYTMENEKERGTGGVKGRLLQSAQVYVAAMGWRADQAEILKLKL